TSRYAELVEYELCSWYGTTRVAVGVRVTPRDMARLTGRLVETLEVPSVAFATGGSLGGMVTLEWVACFPQLTRAAVVFAAPAAHTAQAIGFGHIQRRAIEVGGVAGLEIDRKSTRLNSS